MVQIQPLTSEGFLPYGWTLGKAAPVHPSRPTFTNPHIAFNEQHIFDPGLHGTSQILSVTYRQQDRQITSLEVHRLCQQAVIPLTGEIIQIVALSQPDGTPDLTTLTAFRIPPGEAICMQRNCWHTTRVEAPEVTCLMLTRRSTTIDLIAYLTTESPLQESSIAPIHQPGPRLAAEVSP